MNDALLLQLQTIFRQVKNNFEFKKDIGIEQWTMPPRNYAGKQLIKDDCDGFCLACRVLLRKQNIPNRLVYCEVEHRGRSYGHLVVEASGWIIDNRQDHVLPNTYLEEYRWLRISGFERGDEWREIVGLQA